MAKEKQFPVHIGIIMDGNGRWAKKRGVPRLMGHNAGMESMKKIVIAASNLGVRHLTVYAFSTENWKRSVEEVSGIFRLIVRYVQSELQELNENNVHINILGEYDMLPEDSVASINKLVASTAGNTGLNFNIALNYGGRAEVTKAVNELLRARLESGNRSEVTEEEIASYLYTGSRYFDIPDPDLIIRTSGEERTSNFLLWQSAYSELMFTDTLWPDFTGEELEEMIGRYMNRERRFGGRKEEDLKG
ncbi:MAG: isoprenyl transferase [Mogibacterium sp.]|nr:isoprenyl transferase [Mogibacterium sp.]